ncbi:hypothetical protein [Halobacillus sp. Marseille-Q1614]|uniref:hypothetical protein n=1 Tax=Halobacillus sp. Marseille-Q1614 TaxID=2709134 RepID=UPI001570D65C|nr:hypothetical protein [Halobacillus sp. Marseille-Q1614]
MKDNTVNADRSAIWEMNHKIIESQETLQTLKSNYLHLQQKGDEWRNELRRSLTTDLNPLLNKIEKASDHLSPIDEESSSNSLQEMRDHKSPNSLNLAQYLNQFKINQTTRISP